MSDFNPPSPVVFPDPNVFPDVKFFNKALADLDADDAELAAENKSLNQLVADLQAQLVIAQGLLKRNANSQADDDATRAFIVSRMPAAPVPVTPTPPPEPVVPPAEVVV